MNIKHLIVIVTLAGLVTAPALAKKYKHLPPGLQKKLDRGQSLPPGWQKKVARGEVLDINIYRRGQVFIPVDSHGIITIVVDNKLIRLIRATREILDVFNL